MKPQPLSDYRTRHEARCKVRRFIEAAEELERLLRLDFLGVEGLPNVLPRPVETEECDD